jgi:hypothetical protein
MSSSNVLERVVGRWRITGAGGGVGVGVGAAAAAAAAGAATGSGDGVGVTVFFENRLPILLHNNVSICV